MVETQLCKLRGTSDTFVNKCRPWYGVVARRTRPFVSRAASADCHARSQGRISQMPTGAPCEYTLVDLKKKEAQVCRSFIGQGKKTCPGECVFSILRGFIKYIYMAKKHDIDIYDNDMI